MLEAAKQADSCTAATRANNRFHCWPCQCPPLPLWDGEAVFAFFCFLTPILCLSHTTSCCQVKMKYLVVLSSLKFFLSAVWSVVVLFSLKKKTLFISSFLSPAAGLGLYFWAGFQRPAMWSSHIARLQDALSLTVLPYRVWLMSTRRRRTHSHDHRQPHNGMWECQKRPKTR